VTWRSPDTYHPAGIERGTATSTSTTRGTTSFAIKAEDVFTWGRDKLYAISNPHAAEYAALETLDLDTRLEFFEDNFGTAKSVFDLCSEALVCPEDGGDELRMYIHETDDLAIRAVFDDEQLEMYAVTLMSDTLSPAMNWLDWDLGDLGQVTFDEALDTVETIQEPTDYEIFLGPQATAYAEVVAAGAPANYRGLLLGWAPDGYAAEGMAFDLDSAHAGLDDLGVLAEFRSGTKPNTFGEFRDDGGAVGNLLHEAGELIPLLFVGTEL
jgi:hypothetical protein